MAEANDTYVAGDNRAACAAAAADDRSQLLSRMMQGILMCAVHVDDQPLTSM